MTIYTALKIVEKYQINSDKIYFRVSKSAASEIGTSAELIEGTWIKLTDLYYAMMVF
jgi:hypothetical protein